MEKGIQNSHGARPVNQDVESMWWIRTSRLSIKNSLSLYQAASRATEEAVLARDAAVKEAEEVNTQREKERFLEPFVRL